jgi:hypothetical protein
MTKDEARAAAIQATKDFAEKVANFQVECTSEFSAKLAALEPQLKEFTKAEKAGIAAEIDAILNEAIIT